MARGGFIVIEGLDRTGKTTQARELVQRMRAAGLAVEPMNFPDRSTDCGQLIGAYLQNKSELDDRVIHLLFSANRWEKARDIRNLLAKGTSIVCDRYSFSGIAYTRAKPASPSLEWCIATEVGLPAPDVVIFLKTNDAEKRNDFGKERYETKELQDSVALIFEQLHGRGADWLTLDAGKEKETVSKEIFNAAVTTVCRAADEPLQTFGAALERDLNRA